MKTKRFKHRRFHPVVTLEYGGRLHFFFGTSNEFLVWSIKHISNEFFSDMYQPLAAIVNGNIIKIAKFKSVGLADYSRPKKGGEA